MDDDEYKDQMARLQKFRRETDWMPFVVFGIVWASMWWSGIEPEPQVNAVLGVVALVSYVLFREVRSMHATFMLAQIQAARGQHIRL